MAETGKEAMTELEDAMEMLGAGYSVSIEPPTKTYQFRGNRMVETETPAWVRFSTAFKGVLVDLNEYALKVFLYIGLSINFDDNEAWPGVRKIASDLGMNKDTVTKAVDELERKGLLAVQRRTGASNLYRPIEYISAGKLSHQTGQPVSGENAKLSDADAKLSGEHPLNMHNKKNKKEQEVMSIENKIFLDLPVNSKDLQTEELRHEAPRMFERAFGFGTLPWGTTKDWQRLMEFVVDAFAADRSAFGNYVVWRAGDGKYAAMSNKQIRTNPQVFMDTGWPEFLASKQLVHPLGLEIHT